MSKQGISFGRMLIISTRLRGKGLKTTLPRMCGMNSTISSLSMSREMGVAKMGLLPRMTRRVQTIKGSLRWNLWMLSKESKW